MNDNNRAGYELRVAREVPNACPSLARCGPLVGKCIHPNGSPVNCDPGGNDCPLKDGPTVVRLAESQTQEVHQPESTTLKLYRYSCGCIGTHRDGKGVALMFSGDDQYGLYFQYVDHDPVEELSPDKVRDIISKIEQLISDREDMRRAKAIFARTSPKT